ncbi:MAG: hypothetical protein AMJ53_03695 [Gammaproteobacteria bacterium SG8_11]|nr:MAG: hypothetical protein AMJ53_03695 [Gammaproteobacteria bacterium SG8_11]
MEIVESFKRELTKSGMSFLALSPLPALKAHVQFIGKLNEQEVLWDATIQTLASYLAENPQAIPSKKTLDVRSFMQVEPPENGVSLLKVVLAVPLIDEPTIKKTIIMIRCYKRLKVGYHEFGKNL